MDHLRLMQVHAHPDDEASKGAATTARYAAEGVRCVLVTCTGGEAGEILNPKADTPEARADLAAVRARELEASAAILGYAKVYLLGYRDSGMPDSEHNRHPDAFVNADLDEAVRRLVAIVREERPHVILAYGEDHSGYPHPDHIRAHEVARAAFDAAADPSRYPGEPWAPLKLYYMGFVVRQMRAMHEALVARGRESWYADRLKDADEAGDAAFGTRIRVADFLGHRSRALRAHATQVDPASFWFALSDEERAEVYPFEDFALARARVAAPPDEDDLFAGIR